MLVALLRKVGFDVSAAVNGQEAVKLWEQQQPHLIWMDLRMPLLDGYEATKNIKSAMKKAQSAIDTKIIALTASAFEENKVKALDSGCNDFVRKPFRESDIFNIMTKYLGVRYIYEEDKEERLPTTELQSMLSGLSSTLLNDLAVASGSCNADEIDRIIDDIRDIDNNLGNSLAQLSEKFAYKEIMGLIDKVKNPIAGQ